MKQPDRRDVMLATGAGLGVAVPVLGIFLMIKQIGIIDTVAYVFAFGIGATLIPGLIVFGAPSFPGFMKNWMGGLHWVLGQVGFGGTYLVDKGDEWKLCPGRREKVYIDGEWRTIGSGYQNRNVLGWMPFGIIWDKSEQLTNETHEILVENVPEADGGAVERGGVKEVQPPNAREVDGHVAHLKQMYSSGLRKMGDIDIIEEAEEVMMRSHSEESGIGSGMGPIIGGVMGLIIGIITGYVMLGAA